MKEIKVKSNGLRNELKDIRKSIDKLTEVLTLVFLTQTNKHEEINTNSSPLSGTGLHGTTESSKAAKI